ncbi:MAG: hypothetical protein PHU99_09450 [Candidatus Cloacimonetes bacterium]|nr:hypothetical protein [Candidatus Cloacimonadota bacterium]MDD3097931.1 hypothetical protein [Candidatus Cloacimonadota bacterium]MDD3578506.1 hypothetical protein [Candidatus Cloacimonadota bacterium]MDD4035703.1 hypothetical protein [Candidatus Cloacimonadota bacterium]
MSSTYYHLRLDVRKVQDFIFRVPKLKYMLGANSCIGELFSKDLPDNMLPSESLFSHIPEDCTPEIRTLLEKNILSSAGGHFEAVFQTPAILDKFVVNVCHLIRSKAPGLEITMSKREFSPEDTWKQFMEDRKSLPIDTQAASPIFVDAPFYQLCTMDGDSVGVDREKGNVVGASARMMSQQAESFYSLKTVDTISRFYKANGINCARLPKELTDLAKSGKSTKTNMLAYIKADGNGTGARFREVRDSIDSKNVFEAFIEIERFWHQNRKQMNELLSGAVSPYIEESKYPRLPFILLMLGGDDLFMISTPEIALDIASKLASADQGSLSVSVGVAFVKDSHPVAQANEIAEMCLESAKAAGYAKVNGSGITPYVDWHVHFDSVYQDLKDLRLASYVLSYSDNDQAMTEVLSMRPYTSEALTALLSDVQYLAKALDSADAKIANNKIKTYRSALKNGYKDVEFLREILFKDDTSLDTVLEYEPPINGLRLDSSLDKIEIIDFYRLGLKDKGANHANH